MRGVFSFHGEKLLRWSLGGGEVVVSPIQEHGELALELAQELSLTRRMQTRLGLFLALSHQVITVVLRLQASGLFVYRGLTFALIFKFHPET